MRVLVVGAGALGSVFGCLLRDQGHEVGLLEPTSRLDDIRQCGLTVTGLFGDHHCEGFGLYSSAKEVAPGRHDLVLITVKSFHTAEAASQIAPVVGDALLISLQNGIGNYEAIAAEVGNERTLAGRVIFGARMIAPARAEVTVFAEPVMIGSPADPTQRPEHPEPVEGSKGAASILPRIDVIAAAFSDAGIPTQSTTEITKYIWSKMLYNCALNPLSALLNVPYGRLLESDESRMQMRRVVEEIFTVCRARGIALFWQKPEDYVDLLFGRLIPDTAAHYASMAQDLQAGRRTEIEALNGAVVRLGEEVGIPCPANAELADRVRAAESVHRS